MCLLDAGERHLVATTQEEGKPNSNAPQRSALELGRPHKGAGRKGGKTHGDEGHGVEEVCEAQLLECRGVAEFHGALREDRLHVVHSLLAVAIPCGHTRT